MGEHALDHTFDFFLSHNSQDKPVIRAVARLPAETGIPSTLKKGEGERRPRLGARASGPHAFHSTGKALWRGRSQDQPPRDHQGAGLPA
jgi:hypothetical protein